MSQEVCFENVDGEAVTVPLNIAKKLFRVLADADAVADVARDGLASQRDGNATTDQQAGEQEAEDESTEQLKFSDLEYDKEVLLAAREYAMLSENKRTANIPKPLVCHFDQCVTADEKEFMQRVEASQCHLSLLDFATFLKFKQLENLCSAYISSRIDEIARAAPDIMTGAEHIRDYLQMENEWTEEEMGHLRKEMEYAKNVDPNVF